MNTSLTLEGKLNTKKVRNAKSAPFSWKLKQWTRKDFLYGLATSRLAKAFSKVTGIPMLIGELRATARIGGERVDFGLLSTRVVTTAFVEYMVDQLQTETSTFGDFKFHDSGVGTTAAAVGDTDIETTDAVARTSGTQTESSSTVYRSVGSITYGSSLAITEHGLFNDLTAGTLLDRHVFAAINVVATDQIDFTYDLTVSAGG